MDVSMRVDATGHTAYSFYSGHGHPFSLCVEGWHGRSGSERRAVWVVLAIRTNHPNSETGRAGFNVQLEGLGRRHPKASLDSESGRTQPVLPKLLRTSTQAVDPQRSINQWGHPQHGWRDAREGSQARPTCVRNLPLS